MKIAIASDIHLEFGNLVIENTDNADVLILAGDICVASDALGQGKTSQYIQNFFYRVSQEFKHVIYIMGNHEHYHGDFAESRELLQQMIDQFGGKNVFLMDKDSITIDDIVFVGGTYWTNFYNGDVTAMTNAAYSMNDYRVCHNSAETYNGYKAKLLQPKHTLNDHLACHSYISEITQDEDKRYVVITHHAPCKASVAERFQNDYLMNANFYSDQIKFIVDRPQIKLWVHGHMHNESDYMLANTRVVCNPRGYCGQEVQADNFKLKIVEV